MSDTADRADATASPGPRGTGAGSRGTRAAKVLLRVGVVVFALAALTLCAVALVRQWSSVADALRAADVPLLVLAALVAAAVPLALGVAWWRCLAVFGTHVPLGAALRFYAVGELGKYVPGGVWPVVGRGELATRGGVARGVAYASTLVGMAAMCVAAGGVAAVLVPFLVADGQGVGADLAVLLLLPAGAVAVHPAVFGRVLGLARRVTRGRLDLDPPPWPDMLRLVAWNMPAFLALGLSAVVVTEALDLSADPARIAFAAVLAWVVGFLAVPVPAGAGVREIVFVTVCGLVAGPAIAVAALCRLLLLAADLLGGLIGIALSRRRPAAPVAVSPEAGITTPEGTRT